VHEGPPGAVSAASSQFGSVGMRPTMVFGVAGSNKGRPTSADADGYLGTEEPLFGLSGACYIAKPDWISKAFSITRHCASDYKCVVCLPTFVATTLDPWRSDGGAVRFPSPFVLFTCVPTTAAAATKMLAASSAF
jgi:hypothetical protein